MYSKIQSEYVILSYSGEYIDLVCSSWIENNESEMWRSDNSMIRSRRSEQYHDIDEDLANDLLEAAWACQ